MDLIKQFFSFDKLMKDRLVAAFFYLGVFAVIIAFFVTLRSAFSVMGYSAFYGCVLLVISIFQTLFLFVVLRLAAELMIAIFHINDNLSPDGGKAETAGLDIVDATLKAAGKAAKTATVATKSVVNKTKSTINDIRDSDDGDDDDDDYPDYEDPTPKPKSTRKAKPAAKKPSVKKPPVTKPSVKKTAATPKTIKPKAKTPTARKSAAKTTARKPAAKKKSAAPRKKPSPKS